MEIYLSIITILLIIAVTGFYMLLIWERLKSKKPEIKGVVDYSKYEDDFKYLYYIISRERDVAFNYVLSPMEIQFDEKLTITDEDVENIVIRTAENVISYLSGPYKNYLIEKYFETEERLIRYIVEELQLYLTSKAIGANYDRAKKTLLKNRNVEILGMNNKTE